jgi:hypothetical protein
MVLAKGLQPFSPICHGKTKAHRYIHSGKERLLRKIFQMLYLYIFDIHDLQYFLRKSIPENFIHYLSKYRLSSHKLAIEQGRYNDTERSRRACKFCNLNKVEDEYHFILECPHYGHLRSLYIKKYYYWRPSTFDLNQLLTSNNLMGFLWALIVLLYWQTYVLSI